MAALSNKASSASSSGRTAPGTFTVLYFASAAAFTGKDSDTLNAPLPLVGLSDVLEERYPGIKRVILVSAAVTVNMLYVDVVEDSGGETRQIILEGDEVGIIPPVSSG